MLPDNFRGDSESADFSVYRLLPFNEAQIRHYLKAKLPTRDPDAVMTLFCRVHNLRELVERPLLLSFIVKRIERIETISATGPGIFNAAPLSRHRCGLAHARRPQAQIRQRIQAAAH